MANVIRLVNGGAIQVRTGVLAGVGPVGPRGPVGPQGMSGEQGPVGPAGPQGEILQLQARANISSTTNLTANTAGNIAFGTVVYDDLSCLVSTTNITFQTSGDFLISAYVTFPASAGTGIKQLSVVSTTNGTLWKTVQPANAAATTLEIHCPYRVVTALETVNIKGLSTLAAAISEGALVVTRIGSGPVGPVGPAGIQGPAGPAGPQGAQGPAGNASSGFTTYADLL